MVRPTIGNKFLDVAPIGFKEEFDSLIEGIKNLGYQFRFQYLMATRLNLERCLKKNVIGLHFSGHGFQNNLKSFSDPAAFDKAKGKGDFLLFEKNDGSGDNMYSSELE